MNTASIIVASISFCLLMIKVEKCVYFLKLKSEVFNEFQKFKALVEKESGCHITSLRFDNGGESCCKEFNNFVLNMGSKDNLLHPPLHNRM